MKKILNELEWEEITTLYDVNNWLRDQIASEAVRIAEDCRDDILHYLRSNKHIHYKIGGYNDYIKTDVAHMVEFIDLVETMYNDGAINLPYSSNLAEYLDNKYFFQTSRQLAIDCKEYAAEGLTTDSSDEFYDSAYEEAQSKLNLFLDAIKKELFERCNNQPDEMDVLETWWYNNGADYATDGRYIFEVNIRRYA